MHLLLVAVWNNLEFEKDINAETHIDQYVLKHGLKFPMEIGNQLYHSVMRVLISSSFIYIIMYLFNLRKKPRRRIKDSNTFISSKLYE